MSESELLDTHKVTAFDSIIIITTIIIIIIIIIITLTIMVKKN